jgi:hypothetical protein
MGESFQLRVKPEQKKRWRAAASAARRTLSDWIRVTLDEAAGVEPEEYAVGGGPEGTVSRSATPSGSPDEGVVSGPSESRQVPDLAIDVPVPAAPIPERAEVRTGKLAPNCTGRDLHWRLKKNERCRFCGGYA